VAVTAAEIQTQILLEVGDVDPATGDPPTVAANGVVYGKLEWLWTRYAYADAVAPGLREQLVKRSAILMVLAVIRPKSFDMADTLAGPSYKLSQVVKGYEELLSQTDTDIKQLKSDLAGASSGSYKVDTITRTAPYTPDYPPDGNWWRRYGGSPYTRRGRRGGTAR
jgi:hypothetical protein